MTNSEKIGYKKRPKTIYGLPEEPISLPTAPTAAEL